MSSSNSTDRAMQVTSSLPTMNECIQNLCPTMPPPTEGICTICQISFGEHTDDDDSTNTDQDEPENTDIVQTPCPGAHTFHYACLLRWFSSIHDKRTQCPNCNEVLFRPSLLTPAQAAEREAEKEQQFDEAIHLNRGRFAALMAETDRKFEDHRRLFGIKGLVALVYDVQDWYHEQAGGHDTEEFLSDDHCEQGDAWILYIVVLRVVDLLHDVGITGLNRGRDGFCSFLGWINGFQEGPDE